MEGLADSIMRGVLTAVGGYDWCVTEFVRVSGSVLPNRVYYRSGPELLNGSRTAAGTPVRVQLLGSDPACLADNAARLATLNPAGIDLNFGCPAPLVNRHGGGAALLGDPELLYRIASAVRQAVPDGIPYTAKMRLGINDPSPARDCALALQAGGVEELVVHGRTRVDGYRPPARWEDIARVREAVSIPVIANGEIWTVAEYEACRQVSGCSDIMLGRGAIADPWLARRARGETVGGWDALRPAVADYWAGVQGKISQVKAPGRLKQWLGLVRRIYPEAEALYQVLRPLTSNAEVGRALHLAGIAAFEHGPA